MLDVDHDFDCYDYFCLYGYVYENNEEENNVNLIENLIYFFYLINCFNHIVNNKSKNSKTK